MIRGAVQLLTPQCEKVFISLYKIYGRSWDWSHYASAVSNAVDLRSDARITGPQMRRHVEFHRARLQEMGLSFPQLPRRIDKERFAELYRAHGSSWTWGQYAKELSRLQGFTGKDELSATSISAHVSRNREELHATPRHVDAQNYFPWPTLDLKAYKQQTYWRFLLLYLRVLAYGEETLKSSPNQYKRFLSTINRLWRDKEVIRYDPDRGFYTSPAHPDELDQSHVVELQHHYFARHPEQIPKD
jgi:hypothetical protein